jgi:hypothetical protein
MKGIFRIALKVASLGTSIAGFAQGLPPGFVQISLTVLQ